MKQQQEMKSPEIDVSAQAQYVPDQSNPQAQHYFFAYTVRIQNRSTQTVQLLNRHWIITDGWGRINEVKGSGVVGQQPKLRPGESFEYSSFCPLPTPTGTMRGFFNMTTETGESFDTEIPSFYLIEPNSYH